MAPVSTPRHGGTTRLHSQLLINVRQRRVQARIMQRVVVVTLAALLNFAPACPSAAATSSVRDLDSSFIDISREVHRFRHWRWSGIFPLYGGWIPDPHFLVTSVFGVPADVGRVLGDTGARYQGVDINPWFEDSSSEIVLAIESRGIVHEYTIPNNLDPPLSYGFVNNSDRLYVFPYRSGLAFLTSLDISRHAFLLVSLPLQKTANIAVVYEGSSEYDEVVAYLGSTGRYRSLKENPCRGLKDIYELFERCPDF